MASLFRIFSKEIGIDLGTANTLIYVGEGSGAASLRGGYYPGYGDHPGGWGGGQADDWWTPGNIVAMSR